MSDWDLYQLDKLLVLNLVYQWYLLLALDQKIFEMEDL